MRSIRGKMLVGFGLTLVVLLALFGVIHSIQVRDTVIPLTKELSEEVLIARSAEIGRLISGYESDVRTMSRQPHIREGSTDEIGKDLISRAQMINGDYEMLFYADYNGRYITTLGSEGNVVDRDYFIAIMKDGLDSFISNPLVSRATGEHVFVVASVVLDHQGQRKGLIASTVLLKTLSQIVESIAIGDRGFGFVVDHDGLLIAHPNDDLRMSLNLLESDSLGFEGLEAVGQAMVRGESGVLYYKRPDGSNLATVFHRIPHSPGWSLGISIYESELMGKANDLMRSMIIFMVGILVAVIVLIVWISSRIASPIRVLKEGVKTISSGNLDHALNLKTGDEIEELAHAFNKMTVDLKTYIEDLKTTTAQKERIEGELRVAHKIQSSMLPRIFPPYPNIKNLDLFAMMEPAREVGGDFYDFFLLNDGRLCFTIGDVSGKGIPAALFMVITRTILKNEALQGNSLADIFSQTNQLLCSDNEENMFVTAFMGALDTATGELEYVCAGHNAPLIGKEGGDYAFLPVGKSLVLGGMPDYPFKTFQTVLQPGDVLFLYTDGVTEAMDEQGQLFSDDRMVRCMNAMDSRDVKEIIAQMRKAIDQFVLDTPASDDVTMLALSLKA